ncbi:MAG: NrfD/PsrC family molybdoenzyme membrane anchor subunit [candidate division NC10 bacterium]|nr:NrfD/PsrC family molybdoenzyme membrane anchor subunit [candidate division NC10 bacterium]
MPPSLPPFELLEPILLSTHKWSATPHVPLYLFFGGLAAGIFIVAAICDLVSTRLPRFEAVARVGGYLAFPMAAIGGLFLTLHLGKPERGILFPIFFTNFESVMVIGGWILAAFLAVSAGYLALWYFGIERRGRMVVAIVGIPLAIALGAYTGFLLSGTIPFVGEKNVFIPLWNEKYLPLMFLNSGITTGIALAGVATLVATRIAWPPAAIRLEDRDRANVIRWLTVCMGIAILVESFELYSFLSYLSQQEPIKGGKLVVHLLTQGDLAPWFWGGVVGVALALPFLLAAASLLTKKPIPALAYSYFGLALIGGMILRFVIVWGGELKQPLALPPSMWPMIY